MDPLTVAVERQASAYLKASSLAVLVYDWIITCPLEVDHIWGSKWNIIKFLYLFIRYTSVIDTVLALQVSIVKYSGVESEPVAVGTRSSLFNTLFSGIGIGLTQLLLMTWTYILYGRSRRILAFFGLSYIIVSAVSVWAVLHGSRSFSAGDGILPGVDNSVVIFPYASVLIAETVTVTLTVWKSSRMGVRCGLLKAFHQCGTFFYIAVWPISFVTVLLLFLRPHSILQLDTPFRVMHTILCCRLVVYVRAIASRKEHDDTIHSRLTESFIREAQMP